jgi:hypothetical protein
MRVATILRFPAVASVVIQPDKPGDHGPGSAAIPFEGSLVNAIKSARKFIVANPSSESARTLAQLVLALESETQFNVAELYKLDLETFEIAIDILKEWRIDRYYAGKAKLFDLSVQVTGLPS